jgi:transcriptional regulator with XRE-family HTH domain
VTRDSANWTDAEVAERLGAFLAYRLPVECDRPEAPTNVYALRAAVACAINEDLPESDLSFLIGVDQPAEVSEERLGEISDLVEVGALSPRITSDS